MPSDPALAELITLLGTDSVLTDAADCVAYAFDNSRRSVPPRAVVMANKPSDVEQTVRWCAGRGIPLTVRGRGTNTVGASVPLSDGIALSLERMNRVIDYSPADRMITVEAGCLNQTVQEYARKDGLFWAPDPTSAAYSSVGGNLGCNAGGPHAVRYGTCRDNILGLSAVIGDGSRIRVGSRTTKSVVGLDLTRLLVGSEGTLGVITQATLKLTPLPQARRTIRAEFRSVDDAAQAVSTLLAQADSPAVCEFMDDQAVGLVRPDVSLAPDCCALLLLECHGSDSSTRGTCAAWKALLSTTLAGWQEATEPAAVAGVWAARKALSPRLRSLAPNKTNEDVVVPVSRIPELVGGVREISSASGIPIVCFGHAGNGNLHVNLMYDRNNPAQAASHDGALRAVFELTIRLGGSLSGEHGVGLAKRDFVGLELDAATLNAMRAVKKALDPHNILNPDKGLPRADLA